MRKVQARREEILRGSLEREGSKRKSLLVSTPPPSPYPLKASTGAGFTKCVCKILSPKGLEVKILKTKHLAGPRGLTHGYADAYIASLGIEERKVRCHTIGRLGCGFLFTSRQPWLISSQAAQSAQRHSACYERSPQDLCLLCVRDQLWHTSFMHRLSLATLNSAFFLTGLIRSMAERFLASCRK